MKINVVGCGGVGGYFGARLLQAGHEVQFAVRSASLERYAKQTLSLKSTSGDVELSQVVFRDIASLQTPDLWVLTTKLGDLSDSLAGGTDAMLGKLILPLQNGLDTVERVAEVLPDSVIVPAFCGLVSERLGPGAIEHKFGSPFITIDASHQRSEDLSPIDVDGIDLRRSERFEPDKWIKFGFVFGWGIKGAMADQASFDQLLLSNFINLVYELGKAEGLSLQDSFPAQVQQWIDKMPDHLESSLVRDLRDGNQGESKEFFDRLYSLCIRHKQSSAPLDQVLQKIKKGAG